MGGEITKNQSPSIVAILPARANSLEMVIEMFYSRKYV